MGRVKVAEGAQQAFDQVADLDCSLFDARVDHEWARNKRYAGAPVDAELEALLRGWAWPRRMRRGGGSCRAGPSGLRVGLFICLSLSRRENVTLLPRPTSSSGGA